MLSPQQLKRQRLALGLTQIEFARLAGVSQSVVAKFESGALDPKLSTAQRIASALATGRKGGEPLLRDVMHAPVVVVSPSEALARVIERMQRDGYSQLPVVDHGMPVGVVTEQSALHALTSGGAVAELAARDAMDAAPPLLPADTPLSTAVALLEHVPLVLVRERKQLIGVVTRSDVLKSVRAHGR